MPAKTSSGRCRGVVRSLVLVLMFFSIVAADCSPAVVDVRSQMTHLGKSRVEQPTTGNVVRPA
jgi:hypothetical protein